jgi:hypothetical protein
MCPDCSYEAATRRRAYSKASKIEIRPFRSASAAGLVRPSTRCSGKRVSFRSPPVFVAVTIVRPGPASTGRKAPLELAVLTKTICCRVNRLRSVA